MLSQYHCSTVQYVGDRLVSNHAFLLKFNRASHRAPAQSWSLHTIFSPIDTPSSTMVSGDWKKIATDKHDSVLALIPEEWRIPAPPSAAEQRDFTGKYIQQYLDEREIEITETDAAGIVKSTTSGTWSAYDVAKAFCHRAAVAHQLVRIDLTPHQCRFVFVRKSDLQMTGQLPPRNLLRCCAGLGKGAGRVLCEE